ncbi:fumarylacetoacetate hydrolase family protein [Mesorhizobium sp. LNJC405B00]|uniref:2-keto-4-pentenoate hydratase n=1 Tax=Mesorhizobium sp. LNJC405B00 TaxID=1287281 RepID=UPI0003CE6805|nr:fumarylacetoacetate hydrolase family protein [Mesorhizobium sp. LNJC405B00]ESX83965.1 hypothetical protein X755_32225 [Mesorhizobium sp. LNJC405B00]
MNSPIKIADMARQLRDAEAARQPITRLTEKVPALTVTEAYEIQRLNAEARLAAGEVVHGHKIGLTARVMQIKFNVDEPDYGHLFDTMFVQEGGTLDLSYLIDPQIEVEPAFVLGRPLRGPGVTCDDVIAATDWIVPAFEVIDSRIRNWDIRLQDTVADNGSSARVVLGQARKRPTELPLADLETALILDDQTVETGSTSAILGHPAEGIAWLANALGRHGVGLNAGQVLLPGTATRSHRIAGCKTARAEIEHLGTVTLNFTGEPTVTP